jgi:16S rRNA (guanine527-N7)-methyltransferase
LTAPVHVSGLSPGETAALRSALAVVCDDLTSTDRERALQQLSHYATLLRTWGRKINLVSQADLPDLISLHLIPCLHLRPPMLTVPHGSIIDVGSGCGLPGLPLAITHPSSTFTLVESRRRRASFLRTVVRKLGLANVIIVHGRVEEWTPTEPADLAIARAVGQPDAIAELVRHALAPGAHSLVTLPPEDTEDGVRPASPPGQLRYSLRALPPPNDVDSGVENK